MKSKNRLCIKKFSRSTCHTGTGGYFVTGYLYGKRKNNDHEYDKL